MSTAIAPTPLGFTLDPAHEAHEPPEARGLRRDGGRLLVSLGDAEPVDASFSELATLLAPGDLLVVNTSATIPAALDARLPSGEPVVVHLSGALPGDVWLVEVRQPRDGGACSAIPTMPGCGRRRPCPCSGRRSARSRSRSSPPFC